MSGHEFLNSNLLYIHPSLAIAGYVFIFLFAFFLFRFRNGAKKIVPRLGVAAWILTFLGLATGMIWAQLAWGSYWSWDPKETLTLALFVELSVAEVAYFEKKPKVAKWLALFACILTIIALSSSFVISGLHSFGL